MEPAYEIANQVRRLPPLILHPFSDTASPAKLVQSSRASLMLQGLIPNDEYSTEQLERIILDGRMCEIRMLYYVGKDVIRWIDQCVEGVQRDGGESIQPQAFATLLIEDAPLAMQDKLAQWGVQDYRSIFSRAIGLNAIFAEAPESESLSLGFIRNYHYYADHLFNCWRDAIQWNRLNGRDFAFELYASGEYSRMLEAEWSGTE